MNILSPMPTGNGAYVLHEQLASRIKGYRMRPYSPWWTLFPAALPAFSSSRADLIHSSSDYGLFFKRRRVPLVATVHNYVCDSFMRPYSSRFQYLHYQTDLRMFTRRTLETADRVVAISRFMIDRVRDDLGISVPMRLIYNGVDEQQFTPAATSLRRVGAPIRILFCGNLNRRKRPDLLVPLANALGDGFEIHYTEGLAAVGALHEKPLPSAASLHNLGKVAHANMSEVYRSMDVLFMPSVREGFGLCVAEAMACGLPVVAADASALPELVHQGQGGYRCPIDDVAAYARALKRIAESPEQTKRMGEYNRALVEDRFTLSRMVSEYKMLFEEVMDETGGVR